MQWLSGTVVDKTDWAEGLFTLAVAAEGVADFLPGQFLQLALTLDGEHVRRPYSVASPPGRVVEFYIVVVEGGRLTPQLAKLVPGDSVEVSEHAAGGFTLAKTPDAENLWLFGTGTGLAPYIAMLRTAEPWERYRKIIVVHGVRHPEHLSYQDEFAVWAEQKARHPGQLVYVPTVTRQKHPGALEGRITTLFQDGQLEDRAGVALRPDNSAVMLCGNPQMLDDMETLFAARGLRKHRAKEPGHWVVERYW